MHILGIQGPYGSGKTITSVIKAHQWAAASGAKIFANFPVRGGYLFDHYTDWYRIADVHGSIVIFDESQKNYDGRKWNSAGQIDLTHVINYVRKMNSLFIFVLPDYDNLESRIRKETDVLISCYKTKGGTIINTVYDGRQGTYMNKWVLPVHSQKKVWAQNLYNSHSMVRSFPMPPPNKINEFFEELDRRHNKAVAKYRPDFVDVQTLSKEDLEVYVS